jgi:hypothetical protein
MGRLLLRRAACLPARLPACPCTRLAAAAGELCCAGLTLPYAPAMPRVSLLLQALCTAWLG